MFFQILGTPGGRYAAGAVMASMVAVPIINNLLTAYPALQTTLVLVIAVVIGLAIGWVAGAALVGVGARPAAKAIAGLGAIVVAVIGLYAPIKKAVEATGGTQAGSILHEIFVRPWEAGSLTGAIQYAALSLVVMTIFSAIYNRP